jgi:putative oxidoreductase
VLGVVCLLLGVTGPGRFSLDNALGIEMTGWLGGGIALGVAVLATAGLLATFYRPAPAVAPSAAAATSPTEAAATPDSGVTP